MHQSKGAGGNINNLSTHHSALHSQPSSLNSTLNPQLSTLNPQPSTLNPQPSPLNPQPSTQDTATFATTGGVVWAAAHRLVDYLEATAAATGLSRPGVTLNPKP